MTMVTQQDTQGNDSKRQLTAQMPISVVRQKLSSMEGQFRAALPSHIPAERFSRVVMTAIQNNPELLECDQRSLWNSAMKAASDGLLPDGREGAITVRRDWKTGGKTALWQTMIAGIRKKARNSGEIATWDAHVVYANDEFDFEYGDNPFLRHKPALTNRGPIIAAYSVCTLKSGEKTREVMSIEEIHEVRDLYSDGWKAFKAGKIKSTPWSTSEEEMCRKTVARRHSKVIPMSSDLDDLIRRDDTPFDADEPAAIQPRIKTLEAKLDALAAAPGNGGQPHDPPHDPETGEVFPSREEVMARVIEPIEPAPTPNMQNDPTGEEAARLLKARLDERAEAVLDPTGFDPATYKIVAEAYEKAKGGAKNFKQWLGRASAPDYATIEPHLAALHEKAAEADAGRV